MEAGQILVGGMQGAIWSPIANNPHVQLLLRQRQQQQQQQQQQQHDSETGEANAGAFLNSPCGEQRPNVVTSGGRSDSSSPQSESPFGNDYPVDESGRGKNGGEPSSDDLSRIQLDSRSNEIGGGRSSSASTLNGSDSGGGGGGVGVGVGVGQSLKTDADRQMCDHHLARQQNRLTVIDYGDHAHQSLLGGGGGIGVGGGGSGAGALLADLKNVEFATDSQQRHLQTFSGYPNEYFGLTPLQNMPSAAGSLHSILEYPTVYPQQHQSHLHGVDAHHYYHGAYEQHKLTAQYAGGAWPDAGRPLTIQQYQPTANGYFPPTPPINSPAGSSANINVQAYAAQHHYDSQTLRNWPDSSAFSTYHQNHHHHQVEQQQQQSSAVAAVNASDDNLAHSEFDAGFQAADSLKECVQCGKIASDVWHMDGTGHFLCGSCARRLQHDESPTDDSPPTPAAVVAGRGSSSTVAKSGQAKKSANISKRTGLVCANCQTSNTTLWRRNNDGDPVCNACGLYFKLHKIARPQSMRKDGIQTRKRKARSAQQDGEKTKQSPDGRQHLGSEIKLQAVETRTITTNPYAQSKVSVPLDSMSSFVSESATTAAEQSMYSGLLAPFPVGAGQPQLDMEQFRASFVDLPLTHESAVVAHHHHQQQQHQQHQQQQFYAHSSDGHQFVLAQQSPQQWQNAAVFQNVAAAAAVASGNLVLTSMPLTPPEQISPSQMLVQQQDSKSSRVMGARLPSQPSAASDRSSDSGSTLDRRSNVGFESPARPAESRVRSPPQDRPTSESPLDDDDDDDVQRPLS